MNKLLSLKAILLLFIFAFGISSAEAKKKKDDEKSDTLKSCAFSGLKWRSIGPSFASGRIADFAVNPENPAHYFVAVGSGNIWKTTNNGTTYKPVFENYGAYSIGALAMDPKNPNVVWAGTGENNHQRALGYGNGVYKTVDGGKKWKNMGLKESRHIGEILIDPRDSDIVYVAAEGSTWGPGEERGVFKTTDGGETWEKVLFISENTGAANLCFDPCDPDVIYAGAEQRRRRSFGKIGGGPESAFYKSTDAGKTWNKLESGIPKVDKGGMEIVVSPADRNIVYAMFEATEKGGIYRSTNRGATFKKMNDYNTSGQYYSEMFPDPHNPDKVFSVGTYTKYTMDGGKTWKNVSNSKRHVDDHALWIDPNHKGHLLIGGDGGIYETFDGGSTFVFKSNLPVTQFYRVNVDDTEPFYWVYGGTQDNNSLGGPSRNIRKGGVTSSEWVTTLGGDGFWQASEPGNPDIVYSAYQYGNIFRYDRKSGEKIKIKPMPQKDEMTYRWNWDAPFILSNYSPTRLYMGANKLFQSDDRGNTWKAISDDLTRDEDRDQFKMMGKYWPSSAVAKHISTSQWGTIVALDESTLKEGLIYVGTDDGVVQVTEDNGDNWTKVTSFPGIPEYTYVSDVTASRFDENVVYATFNNTKSDDFKPYVLKSSDKGKTWTSISGDLPENGSVHVITQDTENENLLFVGTEFSFFFTLDGGKTWIKLSGGLPDIAVRDIVIQEKEHDLVIATFGRGFYIIDDYSALRGLNKEKLDSEEAMLFPVKDALMYLQEGDRYGTGHTLYQAKNPEFGATITYYIKEVPKCMKSERIEKEKELFKNSEPIPTPTKEDLDAEKNEVGPYLVFSIKDESGMEVRKLFAKASKGIQRITWDLRYGNTSPIKLKDNKYDPTNEGRSGVLAIPGKYTVGMAMFQNGELKELAGPVDFDATVLNNKTLPETDRAAMISFRKDVAEMYRVISTAEKYYDELEMKTAYIRQAIQQTNGTTVEMKNKAQKAKQDLESVEFLFEGTPAVASWEEVPPEKMPLSNRLQEIMWGMWQSTSAPTSSMKMNYQILTEDIPGGIEQLKAIGTALEELDDELDTLKAPYTPGRVPKM